MTDWKNVSEKEMGRVTIPEGVVETCVGEMGWNEQSPGMRDAGKRIALIADILQWKSVLPGDMQGNTVSMISRLCSNDYTPPDKVWVMMCALKRIESSECANDVFCAMVNYLWNDMSIMEVEPNVVEERMSPVKRECVTAYYRACERDLKKAVKREMEPLGDVTSLQNYFLTPPVMTAEMPPSVGTEYITIPQGRVEVYRSSGTGEELESFIDKNKTLFLLPRPVRWTFPNGSYNGWVMRRWWVTNPLKMATNFIDGEWSFKKRVGINIKARSGRHGETNWMDFFDATFDLRRWIIDLEAKTIEFRNYSSWSVKTLVVKGTYRKLHPDSTIPWEDIAGSYLEMAELVTLDLALRAVRGCLGNRICFEDDLRLEVFEKLLSTNHEAVVGELKENKKNATMAMATMTV